MENIIINTNDGIKHISEIQFGVLSSSDIAKLSSIELVNRGLYTENREPVPYGALDLKLGVNEKGKTCNTCNKKIVDCPGHFGYIRLAMPIFHIGYFKYIINILQCICKVCAKVLLKREDKDNFKRSLFGKRHKSSKAREKIFKNIIESCKKIKVCEYCGSVNGAVKHIQATEATLIIHDRYNTKINSDSIEELSKKFEAASLYYKDMDINALSNKLFEELTSQKVYNLFLRIPKEDIILFDMNPDHSRPIDLLLNYIIVPPLSIRPSVPVNHNSTNEDDLTIKINEMLTLNKSIKMCIQDGNNTGKLLEDLTLLQHTHAQYINSDTKGLNKNLIGTKPIRDLTHRLKGKNGRFRGNLSGKRTDFSGRTVISPDPNLKIDQVGVPILIAKTMTYPQRVFSENIEEMRKLILNGPDVHPGANFVDCANGTKLYLQYVNRKKAAEELKIGDVVERHMMDNDIILFNRQPSLHRLSIMSFRAKILPWRTLRFNECVCTPFNADFDGDEMNLHLPQTEEAKSEALYLMGVKENLITPKTAEPLVSATQDFLTTGYLITQKDFFLDRAHFFQYLTFFNDANEKIDVPPPCILKPRELWSGKQLFSLLLRPNRMCKVMVNVELKAKNFSKKYKTDEFRCINDGYVIIRKSELIMGNIDKNSIGSGSKNGIIFALIRDNNQHVAAEVLSRIAKFSSRWIGNFGMSFGIRDVYPQEELVRNKDELVKESYEKCEYQIKLYKSGQISLKAGMNAEASLESIINKILSDVRETLGSYLRSTLPKSNPALIMAVCGSKGSDINLSQMIACLGQQIVNGQRIGEGFINRTLPHYELNSKHPDAKGFVKNSFYSGLTAAEFFFHTIAGREALVDTAVKTAETGYMQRRLVKALEDLTVQYDRSVTLSTGEVIQFIYGDDGIDPMLLDDCNKIVNFDRLYNIIKSSYPTEFQRVLSASEIKNMIKIEIENRPKYIVNEFINDINTYFKNFIDSMGYDHISENYDYDSIMGNFRAGILSFTETQLTEFFRLIWKKYTKAMVAPGEAVGAVAAQSIGEPGTQMTLKTFHFAGVASMNITLGVPRIKEIINNTKTISTPIITATLIEQQDIIAARIVKGRIEKTKLSEILEYIKEVMSPRECHLVLKLDINTINSLNLEINVNKVKDAIIANKKLKLKDKNIICQPSKNKIIIQPYDVSKENMYFTIQILKKKIGDVIVSGIPSISRAVINKKETSQGHSHNLVIEGIGLNEIMVTPGIDHRNCISNNIIEVEKYLGIEAARKTIINEIKFTMGSHGIYVDIRHLQLVADLMTFKGQVLGFTRMGLTKMQDSTLLHSSFEKTVDNLFESSFHSRSDPVRGVSECIIMGKMIPLGTGLFKTLYDPKNHNFNRLGEIKYKENCDIVEEKLSFVTKKRVDLSSVANFNLINLIR